MNNYNLLASSEDLFQKLLSDFNEFSKDVSSAYKALDCAGPAWHLIDWVFHEHEKVNYRNMNDMRIAFYKKCKALKVMHDIITGYKHLTVSWNKSDMSHHHVSPKNWYTPTYTATYGGNWLMINFGNGDEKSMYALLVEVIEFWKSYFEEKKAALTIVS